MRRIHVSTDARARRLQAGVLLVLAAVLLGTAAQSAIHPEQFARRSQSISTGSITR